MTELHPTAPVFDPAADITGATAKPNWFSIHADGVKTRLKNTTLKQRSIAYGIGILLVAAVVVGVAAYTIPFSSSAPTEVSVVPKDASKPEFAASAAASLPGDAASVILEALSTQRATIERLAKDQSEVRTFVNANTKDIGTLKSAKFGDPKVLQGLKDEVEKIKKIMAVPSVRLEPMS